MAQLPPFTDLFTQLGLQSLPQKEKERIFEDLQNLVNDRVLLRIMNTLNEQEKEKFLALTTEEETTKFLQEKGIDPAVLAMEESLTVREELIRDAGYIEGKLRGK